MDVGHYDQQSRTVKKPLYTYYAQKIKDQTRMIEGKCLDVGACGGYLGLELAKMTNLHVTFFDPNAEALEKAALHLVEDGLEERGATLVGVGVSHLLFKNLKASFILVFQLFSALSFLFLCSSRA